MTTYSTNLQRRNDPYFRDVARWATRNAHKMKEKVNKCVTAMNSDDPMITQFRNGRGRRLCSFP